jgi:hypothetical protein
MGARSVAAIVLAAGLVGGCSAAEHTASAIVNGPPLPTFVIDGKDISLGSEHTIARCLTGGEIAGDATDDPEAMSMVWTDRVYWFQLLRNSDGTGMVLFYLPDGNYGAEKVPLPAPDGNWYSFSGKVQDPYHARPDRQVELKIECANYGKDGPV